MKTLHVSAAEGLYITGTKHWILSPVRGLEEPGVVQGIAKFLHRESELANAVAIIVA